jgi:hypothetical protein
LLRGEGGSGDRGKKKRPPIQAIEIGSSSCVI